MMLICKRYPADKMMQQQHACSSCFMVDANSDAAFGHECGKELAYATHLDEVAVSG
jgi:hypothetical protein